MHIALDARLAGLDHAGIGRYISNLIEELGKIDISNHYTLIVRPKFKIQLPNSNWQVVVAKSRHYSVAEQLEMLLLLKKIKPDVFHVPHFNAPVFYQGRLVVTIHDLLWHEKIGFKATTLNGLVYLIKYFGYRLVMRVAVKKAKFILTPTDVIKQKILDTFAIAQDKVVVTKEAASQIFFQQPSPYPDFSSHKPYLFYTGSLYPHKNVLTLVKSLQFMPNFKLFVSSARSVFVKDFMKQVKNLKLKDRVVHLGFLSDKELVAWYKQAEALVLPSLSEGFGLTGLEAMAAGVVVLCSDNLVLREVYGRAPVYVDTSSPKAIARAVTGLTQAKKITHQKYGLSLAKTYSWHKMAVETLSIYSKAK